MVRLLVIFCITFSFINASSLSVARSFVNSSVYAQKRDMINAIFSNNKRFINPSSGEVDSLKVLRVLKKNGLLNLNYPDISESILSFDTVGNPLLALRVISDTLEDMGFTDFITKIISKHEDRLSWSIVLKSQSVVDPLVLSNKLKKLGCMVDKVQRSGEYYWGYVINFSRTKLKTIPISVNERVKLKKPNRPYWFIIYGSKNAHIASHGADNWHPKVVFYDKFLNPLSQISSDKTKRNLDIDIPKDAFYMEVKDRFMLENIKRGITLILR